ncbi:helix-turn-helix domain-containing protein [Paenibacillus daejeonensis]|uniref:helix-turn-helix domain-containing protein n=1 Tax=Paenibacillus daejeonensis TaxID=135193 RepID=UPI0003754652|nr:helix-turn-helix domain-containing protein [Paenibacillus daejeonensis]
MPYNVFVADDEPMIRYGLISCIVWEEEGLRLLGEASNGEAALKKLQEEPADILITDIKMPIMDGLELVRQAKTLNPRVQAILVSSYNDFEYAREAVKLGVVVDYLLKPTMEPEDLLAIVRTCKAKLDEQQEHIREEARVAQVEHSTQLRRLEGELRNILAGQRTTPAWMPEWMRGPLMTSIWRHVPQAGEAEGALDHLLQLETAMSHLPRLLPRSVSFIMGEEEFLTLLSDQDRDGFAAVEGAQRQLQLETGLLFTVGVSPAFHHWKTLPEACRWAKIASFESFFAGEGRCFAGKIATQQQPESLAQPEDWHGPFHSLREQFSRACASADEEDGRKALEALYDVWQARTYSRAEVISQAQSLLTILWSRGYKHKSEQMMLTILDQLQHIRTIGTLRELMNRVRQEYERQWASEGVELLPGDSGSAHIIQLALAYIQEHYRRELSLQMVADHVHMSKNYFSEQFKKRTGLNYIDFVIRLRVHYAKQMLADTSLKIHDIGQMSGFNSPKHFLKLFKREVGCTPAEYRMRAASGAGGEQSDGKGGRGE